MIWFGWILWHTSHYWLFNTKSYLFIYIEYIRFNLVWFYGIITIEGYFMLNSMYQHILNIHDLVWLIFTSYQQM